MTFTPGQADGVKLRAMADDEAKAKKDEERGKKLLTAVERILTDNDSIRALVREAKSKAAAGLTEEASKKELRRAAAKEVVRTFSNRAAVAGGASGLPALIPGVGSIALGIGGGLAELTFLLKFETEMALALTHLHGFDIDEPRERQLAFLMASVGTYDAAGKNFFVDVAKVEGAAIWNYGPRRLGRLVVTAATMVAAMYLWRGLLKMVPLVGIAVGTSMNKLLTQRVGDRCTKDLELRRRLFRQQQKEVQAPLGTNGATPPRKKKKVVKRKAAPAVPEAPRGDDGGEG